MKRFFLPFIVMFFCNNTFAENDNNIIIASRNGFLYEGAPTTPLKNSKSNMELKNQTKYTRYSYCEIPINNVPDNISSIHLQLYLTGEKLAQKDGQGNLIATSYNSADFSEKNVEIKLFGTEYTFADNWEWDDQPIVITPDNLEETELGTLLLTNEDKDTFLSWDVTEFIKLKKSTGAKNVCFRLSAGSSPSDILIILRQLYIKDGIVQASQYNPHLTVKINTAMEYTETENTFSIFPTITKDILNIKGTAKQVEIYNMAGALISKQNVNNKSINISQLPQGFYLIKAEDQIAKFRKE